MTNEKDEFNSKGVPSELIFDNGKSYQTKDLFRGDSKDLVERNFQKTKDFRGDSKGLVERSFQKTKDDSYQGDMPEGNKR